MATPSGEVKAGPRVMVCGALVQPVVLAALQVVPSMTETVFPAKLREVSHVDGVGQGVDGERSGSESDMSPNAAPVCIQSCQLRRKSPR